MKNTLKFLLLATFVMISSTIQAQLQPRLQYFRPVGQEGLNVYETSKEDTVGYEGIKVRVGGDFAMQFQGINHNNAAGNLADLGADFNLPAANLNLDVQLQDGVRMHLRTYLSSRHHPEAWIKGGHMQVDKLDFIKEGFLEGFMKIATLRVGLDEFNYGDARFRRSDNAGAIYNPFVGNYIMDAFSTEAFGDITLQKNGFLGVFGMTNGKLNQNVVRNPGVDNQPSFYTKLGYDKQLNEDLRVRLTGSLYTNQGATTGTWLYGGDRAGARYYNVMRTEDGEGTNFEPRFNARFTKLTAIQINPFVKYRGFEFFGIYEQASGSNDNEGAFTQLAAELIYRFGQREEFYLAGRYNSVSGNRQENSPGLEINRVNVGGGWFMTNNIMAKLEYVAQSYEGNGWAGTKFEGGSFSGVNLEAIISF